MSADRELLEWAAKAAGHGLPGPEDTDEIGRQYVYSLGLWVNFPWGFDWWAPLTDDGDALRLAVKLGLDVDHFGNSAVVEAWVVGVQPCAVEYNSDPYAATRRAIVRSAAEIGKGMQ